MIIKWRYIRNHSENK